MNNKQFAIVGKVINGRITVMVATQDRVTGYSKPLNNKAIDNTRIDKPTVQPYLLLKREPLIKKVDDIDVPQFMKDRSKQMQEQQNRKKQGSILDLTV